MAKYLVEIRTKIWVTPEVIIGYIEVNASDEYYARHAAFAEFETSLQYTPSLKKKFNDLGITVRDVAAADAVEI